MAVHPAAEPFHEAARRTQIDDFDRDVWCVLGVPIDNLSIPDAVDAIEAAVDSRRRLSFVTLNVNWLTRALRDDAARREILEADLSLADGAPLVLMARLLGAPIGSRAAGSDLFEALREKLSSRRVRVFFFGGREGAGEAASAALGRDSSGLEAAGWFNPGYGDVDSMSSDETIRAVNAAKADFIIVSLGAAKGQRWIARNQARLEAPVIAHLGAVVDFTAGRIKRSPAWVSRAGFEWLWRIAAEPALWPRYLGDGVALTGIVARRFAPQLFLGRNGVPGSGAAVVEQTALGAIVRLSGDLVGGGLGAVRAAFRETSSLAGPVTLDFEGVRRIDRAFLGLVLMLEKRLPGGNRLSISGAAPALQRLLRANSMAYPIAPQSAGAPLTRNPKGAAAV